MDFESTLEWAVTITALGITIPLGLCLDKKTAAYRSLVKRKDVSQALFYSARS